MEFVSYDIASNDFRRAGAASRSIKEHLKRIGADAEAIRRTMIAAYEAEMNVVIHSVGGRLEACLSDSQIDVNVVDEGPGIPDVDQAMVEGFSTASAEARALGFGAGMGLPNIKRNSDRLRITSRMAEGTRVSFTVFLKPEHVRASGLSPVSSLYASADRCRDCRACLTACPTQAMRVREGRPSVLEHLCVECTGCIGVCTTEALGIREELTSLDDLEHKEQMLLAVPPALLAGCGADYRPAQVLAALRSLGFAGVITSAPFERALLDAAAAEATTRAAGGGTAAGETAAADGAAPGDAAAPVPAGTAPATASPVIVPSCPAVVNLIELRFPSLVPHLAPFDSPWEAIQAACGDETVAYVVSCPGQRSALLTHAGADSRAEYLAPEVVREAVMVKLTGGSALGDERGAAAGRAGEVTPARESGASAPTVTAPVGAAAGAQSGAAQDEPLTVTGTQHVMAVLEDIENGLLDDVTVVDMYVCEGGCFGSPLLAEDYHVAARRWSRGAGDAEAQAAASATAVAVRVAAAAAPVAAVARRRPFAARPGIRLDPDMARAIEKLARLQTVLHSLPGRDCGACGAPTCASLAEDVVMDRATAALCPYAATGSTDKEV